MRAHEIIRSILDIIDKIESPDETEPTLDINLSPINDVQRFQQILGLIDQSDSTQFSNEPNEKYSNINSVTTNAGGGLNGPKNPADLRGTTISLYPYHQSKPGN